MALAIPIISTFDGGGVSKAINEFKNLEGAGKKAQFAIKKAAVPAAAALAGIGAALFSATKDAVEDAAAQAELARQLTATTGANDKQIASVEEWISAQGRVLGITDDELRPALAGLVRATGSVTEAQKLASQAFDIAAQKGLPLETVTKALEKAYGGNLTALAKLAPEYRQMIKDGASFEDVMYAIGLATNNAATVAANTAEGKFKRFQIAMKETKEAVGNLITPIVEALLPALTAMGNWAEKNSTVFGIVAGAIAGLAAAILVANAAMKAWTVISTITTGLNTVLAASFTAVQVASGLIVFTAIIAGLILAYNKFEWFRNGVQSVFRTLGDAIGLWVDVIKFQFNVLATVFKTVFNGLASLWNNTFGKVSFKVPSWVPGVGGKGFDVPEIPMLAAGGIVTGPTLAMIGEAGPEAVIPLDRMGQMGGGGTTVNINVNGGDPNAVVQALRTYMRQNGSVPIKISNAF